MCLTVMYEYWSHSTLDARRIIIPFLFSILSFMGRNTKLTKLPKQTRIGAEYVQLNDFVWK